jgi:DNA-binding CsgD family transcriptional regulator
METLLSGLTDRERDSILLSSDGASQREIASALGCTENAVEMALRRARKKVRAMDGKGGAQSNIPFEGQNI